ncbi:hypothetical protein AKO1_013727 [Acrasis kona]|uniref:Peptidase M28 domain-containing protein n=1 Tax=Acrasis kona TaxID=1008807 RepID=A0AAW2ZJQ0_9EUKA
MSDRGMVLFKKWVNKVRSFGPRVPGSESHQKTIEFLSNKFDKRRWLISKDVSLQDTPDGKMNFTNIIASHRSPRKKNKKTIILAAHYDSKVVDGSGIIGATDALVPFILMTLLARYYQKNRRRFTKETTLKCVYFDGEESIKEWTVKDSLYGARNLATKWAEEDKIKDIELFINLDLIGHSSAKFYNYRAHRESNTKNLFSDICNSEMTLRNKSKLKTNDTIFIDDELKIGHFQDDLTPFFKMGVPCLHIISYPFPSFWHTKQDDVDNLDWEAIQDTYKILKCYMRNYLFKKNKLKC